jgi:uncharacterized Zn-finger protein
MFQGGHLNRHKQIVHENLRRFKCDLCDKRCASQTDLNAHVKNNHKEIKCNFCETTFEKKPDLRYLKIIDFCEIVKSGKKLFDSKKLILFEQKNKCSCLLFLFEVNSQHLCLLSS